MFTLTLREFEETRVATTAGYGLLLSPENPDAFMSAVRAIAK